MTEQVQKDRAKTWLLLFLAVAAAGLLAVSLTVIRIDPFFRYHDPLPGFPYVIDNQLSQNIGLAERFPYDAVITGSSMTMNFDTRDFTELLPQHPRPIKLTMNGALPHDIARILEAAFRAKGPALKQVFLAIDANTWTAAAGSVKYPYPEYLYDRDPFNDVRYLWNLEVLLDYCLRPLAEREGTELATVYSTDWEDEMYYRLDWILDHYQEPPAASQETPADAYRADTERNLREELLPWIDAHPETVFTCFFPPYSVLYWHDAIREGHLDATLEQERVIAEALLARDNVRVFFFQGIEAIVTDIDGGYMDEIHFRPTVNRRMVEAFADGTWEIHDAGELDQALAQLRPLVTSYDFDPVLRNR